MIRSKLTLAFTGIILFSFLSWNCTKIDSTTLGGDLIPAVDNVNTFEANYNIIANNIDSTTKECGIIFPTDDHVLGYISNDPLFGTTKATLYTELKPAAFPFTFQGEPGPGKRTLDSVVLVLNYKRTYGDTDAVQRVEVYEIAKPFNPDSSTCTMYPFKVPLLGSKTYRPRELNDSVKLPPPSRDTTINQLRIRLTNFGVSLLTQDTIKTDSAFKEILKGFAIVPDNMGNALSYFSIADPRTKLAVYYTYKRTGLTDTSVVTNFGLYTGDKSANHIERLRGASEISTAANTNNPNGDNFIYIQTTPGSFAELKIPGLTGLSNRIIHRAEIIMEQAFSTASLDDKFTPPNFLYLNLRDSFNSPIPCDLTILSGQPDIATFGGYNTPFQNSGNSIARYTFNISRYVQKTITKQRVMPTLKLWAPNYVRVIRNTLDECNISFPLGFSFPLNSIAEGRVKLAGGTINSAAPNRIRLRVIYSNL